MRCLNPPSKVLSCSLSNDFRFEVAVLDRDSDLLSAQAVRLVDNHFHRIVLLSRNNLTIDILHSSINWDLFSFLKDVLLVTREVKSLLFRSNDLLEDAFRLHLRSCLHLGYSSPCIGTHYQVQNAWIRIITCWHELCHREQLVHFFNTSFHRQFCLHCRSLFVLESELACRCLNVDFVSQSLTCILI